MRRTVNSTFVSLDGVQNHMEHWHFDLINAELADLALELLRAADAMLMGRATYESYAAVWPERADDYADTINAMPKYVASTTLETPGWMNTSVIDGDLVEAVRGLKEQDGRDILMHCAVVCRTQRHRVTPAVCAPLAIARTGRSGRRATMLG